jgi:hypothetical protein
MNRSLPALAALALTPLAAQASLITWGPAVDVIDGGASDVLVNGTFVDAVTTYGNKSGSDVMLNGVTFQHYSSYAGTTLTFGSSSISMTYPAGNLSFPGATPSTDYEKLLGNSMYANHGSGTITLGNLTNGRQYQVQLWGPVWNGAISDVFDGQVTINGYNYSTTKHSQYAVGTFTADANPQVINFVAGENGGYYSFAPTAVSLRELTAVPEPGSLLALGCLIGSGALLRSRRR